MSEYDLVINEAEYLVTCNEKHEIRRGASIGINAGAITAISDTKLRGREEFDARGKLIAPGLINTHTHLAMTLLRGWAEGVDLQGFLARVWAAEGAIMDAPTAELGTKLGALEALLGGTTTALDMYLFPAATHQGAVTVGLRHIAGPIFFDFAGLDGMEWDERIAFARKWPEVLQRIGGPQVPIYLMPHATYTCNPDHLRELAGLANELSASIHIHASENERENRDLAIQYQKTPTELLAESGLLNRQTVYGHGVHLNASDVKTLSTHRGAVAHCPGSNLKLASGIADITSYRVAGVEVGLGTDGCSSSNDLDMWSVLRLAGYLIANSKGPENASAAAIFDLATIGGARALGIADLVGSIEVGKRADLIALDLDAPHLLPIHDPYAQLVFAAGRSDVSDVWVDGRAVVTNHRSTQIDYPKLRTEIQARVSNLKERIG